MSKNNHGILAWGEPVNEMTGKGMVNLSIDRREDAKRHGTGFLCENEVSLFYGLWPNEARELAAALIHAAEQAEKSTSANKPDLRIVECGDESA